VLFAFGSEIKNAVSEGSRRKKLDHFYSLYSGGDVVDVGVSCVKHHDASPTTNYFLKHLRIAPECYTGLGVDDLSGLDGRYAGARFVRYDGRHMPFRDDEFEWAFCNAVVEHVEDPLLFVRELCRVAKNVFLTTPNKYFPVETHTGLLFLHWHSHYLAAWLRRHRPGGRINLLSGRQLRRLLSQACEAEVAVKRNRFLGLTMTFTATVTCCRGSS
jgi:SAM-dependent methyltransferase